MGAADIETFVVWHGTTPTVMARLHGKIDDEKAYITQASVEEINCTVVQGVSGGETHDGAVVVADSVFDTLQTDDFWDEDATGYNFRHTIPATAIPTAGVTYEARYTLTMTDEDNSPIKFGVRFSTR